MIKTHFAVRQLRAVLRFKCRGKKSDRLFPVVEESSLTFSVGGLTDGSVALVTLRNFAEDSNIEVSVVCFGG